MRKLQALTLNAACGLMLLSLTGCLPLIIGAAVGAGGVTYANGELSQNIDETVKDTHRAALAGLSDMGLFVVSDELNVRTAKVVAETAQGKKIRISVKALTEYVSEIKIRVGTFGDEILSQEILNNIEKNY